MNSISHQQRMMEIQHMSNACLVTLLPRVQESLQGASKDGSVLNTEKPFSLLFFLHVIVTYCLHVMFFFLMAERKKQT